MLWKLYIKNLAVIKELNLSLHEGLNVFTGETGAGKSIVIDAIGAVLGNRTKKELVRDNENYALIIAHFSNIDTTICNLLRKYDIEIDNDELIIERQIYSDQRSLAKINARPVPLNILKELANYLINIHGQHDTQILLNPQKHIDIVDCLSDNEKLLDEYKQVYKNVVTIKKQINNIKDNIINKEKQIDLLTYQIDEIENANLRLGEDEELEDRKQLMKNSEKIALELSNAYDNLTNDDEIRGLEYISNALKATLNASEYYNNIDGIASRLSEILIDLNDISAEINNYLGDINFNENELNEIENRLYLIDNLKFKYGKTIEEILLFYENAKKELKNINYSDDLVKSLEQDGKTQYANLIKIAKTISEKRKIGAKILEERMAEELIFLDMPNTKLIVKIDECKLNSNGCDNIEILISTNIGQIPKSISKIASGGELSRIMLSFKNVLALKDLIPTMIFDEIDTGVSGKAAQKIGLKLKNASKNKQVLAVTHSGQVAALADYQYLIKKESNDNQTFTTVKELTFEERANEIAQIMSTGNVNDLLIENAKNMILNQS